MHIFKGSSGTRLGLERTHTEIRATRDTLSHTTHQVFAQSLTNTDTHIHTHTHTHTHKHIAHRTHSYTHKRATQGSATDALGRPCLRGCQLRWTACHANANPLCVRSNKQCNEQTGRHQTQTHRQLRLRITAVWLQARGRRRTLARDGNVTGVGDHAIRRGVGKAAQARGLRLQHAARCGRGCGGGREKAHGGIVGRCPKRAARLHGASQLLQARMRAETSAGRAGPGKQGRGERGPRIALAARR
jgi:hypothetical protein